MSKWIYIAIFALLLQAAGTRSVPAQGDVPEYQVKAAFLYQFANYVEWPPGSFISTSSPLVFGVLGADQLADNLELITRDRKIQGRAIQVRRVQPGETVASLHVVFVGQSVNASIDSVLLDMAGMSVLTVTETTSPRSPGSVINFAIIDDRVKFDVSLQLAEQGRLKISSRLLQVAYRVINETQ